MKLATSWEVKEENGVRSIQLFDADGNKISGKSAYWEGSFYCECSSLTSLKGAPESIGGNFRCNYNNLTSLEGAPESVGGSFYCSSNNLTSLEGAPRENCSEVSNVLFLYFLSKGYLFADGILKRIVSVKSNSDYDLYKLKDIGRNKIGYAVYNGEVFSHGESEEEAVEDLLYKLKPRDVSVYKNWTVDTEVTLRDIIPAYRAITGACSSGIKEFVRNYNLVDKSYKIEYIIGITKGHYGHDSFVSFFRRGGSENC